MKSLIKLLLLLLVSCGGGGTGPRVIHQEPCCEKQILFEQFVPTVVINDPGDASGFPFDRGFVVTFDAGHPEITDTDKGVRIVNDSWLAPDGSNAIKAANYSWNPSVP